MKHLFLAIFALLAGGALQAQNLIPDGSFPNTSTSFNTNYNLVTNCATGPGYYCISPTGWGSSDHSNPSDYTMKVDGFAGGSNHLVWGKTINGLSTTDYEFSFWVRPRTSGHTVELDIHIGGTSIGNFNPTAGGWQQFTTSFSNTFGSNVTIEIFQIATGSHTDFDLDDIVLEKFWPIDILTTPNADIDFVHAIGKNVVANENYVYTAIGYQGELLANNTPLVNTTGNWLPWVAKYDTDRNLIWAANISGTNNPNNQQGGVTGIDIDSDGFVYFTGFFRDGSISFDGITFTNSSNLHWDTYVVKLDPSGRVIWAHHIHDPSRTKLGMVVSKGGIKVDDHSGLVYVAGTMAGLFSQSFNMAFPGQSYFYPNGYGHGYLAAFEASTGNNIWVTTDMEAKVPNDLVVDDDHVFIAGTYDALNGALPILADVDLNSLTWTNTIGTTPAPQISNVTGYALTLADNDLLMVGHGYAKDAICFSGNCTSNGPSEYMSYVAKFDKNLNCLDIAEVNATSFAGYFDIVTGGHGEVYLMGATQAGNTNHKDVGGGVNFSTPLTPGGVQDLFISRYDPNSGSFDWVNQFGGGTTTASAGSMHYQTDIQGVYASGLYRDGGMNFGPRSLGKPLGGRDYFIGRIEENSGQSFRHRIPEIQQQVTVDMQEILLFPNPATEHFTLNIEEEGLYSFELYSLLGELVQQRNGLTEGSHEVNVQELNPGVYLYRLTSEEGKVSSGKMVVE